MRGLFPQGLNSTQLEVTINTSEVFLLFVIPGDEGDEGQAGDEGDEDDEGHENYEGEEDVVG